LGRPKREDSDFSTGGDVKMGIQLSEFLPELASRDAKLIESNKLLNTVYNMGFVNYTKSKYGKGLESAAQYFGIEQLYFDWLRTAYAYRRMFI